MKIVTLTLNPAIDKSTFVDRIKPDSKLRCEQPVFEPGGGGINVSRAINKLGGESLAVYMAGGASGKMMGELLEKEKVDQVIIPVQGATRENFIVVDKSTEQQYRFGMPGANVTEEEWHEIFSQLDKLDEKPEFLVASGSLPPGMPETFFEKLANYCNEHNIKLIVDTSGTPLKQAVDQGVYMIKPNLGELAHLVGESKIDQDGQEKYARQLIKEGKAKIVVVSLGPRGAMMVAENLTEYVAPPTVEKRSTVGAGDSMVGGMVLALSKQQDLFEVLKQGVAAGTSATMNPGTQLCNLTDFNEIYKYLKIK